MSSTAFDIDYWPADAPLAPFVSGYHRYVVRPRPGDRHRDVFFPGWANMRFQVAGEDWSLRMGVRAHDPVPRSSLFGPTSHAGYSESGYGIVIGAGLTPLGWTRLTSLRASDFANRVVPLQEVIGADALSLEAAVRAVEPQGIKSLFDRYLAQRLAAPRVDEALVARLLAHLSQDTSVAVSALADHCGLSPRALGRVSLRAFGFTPKLLLRRMRFLRSLVPLQERSDAGEAWSTQIHSDYYDHSHFIRDSHHFLGMSPSAFLAMRKPMMEASMQARRLQLGAPAQALHQSGA